MEQETRFRESCTDGAVRTWKLAQAFPDEMKKDARFSPIVGRLKRIESDVESLNRMFERSPLSNP